MARKDQTCPNIYFKVSNLRIRLVNVLPKEILFPWSESLESRPRLIKPRSTRKIADDEPFVGSILTRFRMGTANNSSKQDFSSSRLAAVTPVARFTATLGRDPCPSGHVVVWYWSGRTNWTTRDLADQNSSGKKERSTYARRLWRRTWLSFIVRMNQL